MIELGKINHLQVNRIGPYSTFLDGQNLGEVMLLKEKPARRHNIGDELEVFVYVDSDDTVVASSVLPSLVSGQVACLEVVALTRDGAFLDWGLRDDLFVPRTEQMGEMAVGKRVVVIALVDRVNQRMIGSARLFKHVSEENEHQYHAGEKVELLICQRTDMGFKAVINGTHLGMLYNSEIFRSLRVGTRTQGFVKELRADKKIDLILQKPSVEARSQLESKILAPLKKNGGVSTLTDKSPPEEIYQSNSVSKKAYKHALGALYRSRLILVAKDKITMVETPEDSSQS